MCATIRTDFDFALEFQHMEFWFREFKYLAYIISNGRDLRQIGVAGTGVNGTSGDGGLAINAQIRLLNDVTVDNSGNVYFTNAGATIRKIDALTGIISTIAGTGIVGNTGDVVDISAVSEGGEDSRLILRGPGGVELAEDDDSGTNANPVITRFELPGSGPCGFVRLTWSRLSGTEDGRDTLLTSNFRHFKLKAPLGVRDIFFMAEKLR